MRYKSNPFLLLLLLSSDGYFQKEKSPRQKVQNISNSFLEHDTEFTELKCCEQSPDLNQADQLWDVAEQKHHGCEKAAATV